MATIYDVSVLAGVSLATVSRVMNKNAKVSEKTCKKVLDAMAELGYRPNAVAQSLASNRSNSVGILVSELKGQFYGAMLSGIEAELREAGKHVIITAGHANEADEIDGIEFLIDRSCDALILHVEAVSDEYLVELSKGAVPFVLINRNIKELADNCVSLDNEKGGYVATKTLIDKGHKDIAYIAGPMWKSDALGRLAGHKRALAEHNLNFSDELFFEGNYRQSGGVAGMNHLIESGKSFSAVVCANDETASGAMTVCRENNLKIPEEVSIVGFDNIIFAGHLYPKLTTLDYPIIEMGHMAAKLTLQNSYQANNLKIKHLFDPELIVRDSVSKIN
ncbi:LacI family DNA-binding transcriptional regulator [Aliikangiella marina]|uniref:LacI family DNA-binding transcriptional regulator n=1 Tax=Aliikangiella marina TaxID=1712262 RepID=A0A545T1A1_9GAMM|nr:LacI family DNA-binding transcriptional regulator [Aliikangiella marina]TQV70969.1 LacI family DNA-binding transcriptional regulator [Aliikangiella marina]